MKKIIPNSLFQIIGLKRNFPFQNIFKCTLYAAMLFCLTAASPVVQAQCNAPSPGSLLFNNETKADSNYVLFAPESSNITYLIQKSTNAVRKAWCSANKPGMAVYLLPGLQILRAESIPRPGRSCGFPGGSFAVYDSNSTFQWGYTINNDTLQQTHDIFPMPNGNVLVDVWEFIPNSEVWNQHRDTAQLTKAGGLWSGMIQEVKRDCNTCQTGHVVWQWRFWDHIETDSNPDSIRAHPELLYVNYIGTPDANINKPGPASSLNLSDWTHMNAVVYHPTLNQIMISSRNLNEIYIIEHTDSATASTDTGGVYGHGGAFLYRWGNPAAYGMGTTANQQLFGQHSPYWVDTTNITDTRIMINNDGFHGTFSPNGYYSAVCDTTLITEIHTPFRKGKYHREKGKAFGPLRCDNYPAPNDTLWECHQGSAQRLHNNNILICVGVPEGPPANTPSGLGAVLYEVEKVKPTTSSSAKNTNSYRIIWAYRLNTGQNAFRCHQYGYEYVNGIQNLPGVKPERKN